MNLADLDSNQQSALLKGMLAKMGNILADAMEDPATFEEADKMYRQLYRGQPTKASELFNADDEEDVEYFEYTLKVPYDPDLLICELCNYKGEGEGDEVALYENVKHLPVFVSKNHSMGWV